MRDNIAHGVTPRSPVGALGTATMAKVPRGSGGLPKQKRVLEVP